MASFSSDLMYQLSLSTFWREPWPVAEAQRAQEIRKHEAQQRPLLALN